MKNGKKKSWGTAAWIRTQVASKENCIDNQLEQ
jgi:hypothetical protein